ncbi:hypothetical protein AMK59_356 [Oryctes borbonicus]|uniref:Serine protease gd N-terminal domain-containing protein n=1 Tax=Oryctes borbonicus TaxID=1629725 RepID=A0A0T6BHS3_9SCAR|nr:hypothetical protein AMK59_356 [Oryctes borbonicus]
MMKLLVATVLLSTLVLVNGQKSLCPDIFEYTTSGPGHWEGALKVVSEYKLHGTWIRLIFDKPVTDLEVQNNLLEVVSKEPNQILLKNNNLILLKGKPVKVLFKVSYSGNDVPSLVGYRLNARDICPPSDE